MKAIIIDDELDSLESLAIEVEVYCPDVTVIGKYNDSVEALKNIKALNPDLLFLDIEMPKLNGFELLQAIGDIQFDVIFITAYNEYALQAFEYNAIDYLLKPIQKNKLITAIDKVKNRKIHNFGEKELKALLNSFNLQTGQRHHSIALPTFEGYDFIDINDIIYAQADGNYTKVFTTNKTYFVSKTLKEVIEMISFSQFFRPHQSYYININHCHKYHKGKGGFITMKNGDNIPVSRAKKEAFLRFLKIWYSRITV